MHVIGWSSEKKMVWIHASTIIAFMTNMNATWYLPNIEFKCNSIRLNWTYTSNPNLAITMVIF